MKSLNHEELKKILLARESHVVCIIAPNYEPRSIGAIQYLTDTLPEDRAKLKIGLLTLQSNSGRVEPLENLKEINITTTKLFLQEKLNLEPDVFTLPYPDGFTVRQLSSAIHYFSNNIPKPFSIIVDITALPRKVIIPLMKLLSENLNNGTFNNVFLLYSWAENYPRLRYSADMGRLKAAIKDLPIENILQEVTGVHAILFLGRQAYDAKQYIDSLPAKKDLNVFVFINQKDPMLSYEVLRANSPLINDTTINLNFFATIELGHEKLMSWANECHLHENGLYCIAPFGPKPLIVSSFIALENISNRSKKLKINNLETDIILLSGHMYSSPYSLGYAGTEIFNLTHSLLKVEDR